MYMDLRKKKKKMLRSALKALTRTGATYGIIKAAMIVYVSKAF